MKDLKEKEYAEDKDPKYIFSRIDSELLIKGIKGEIDLTELAKEEIINRGYSLDNKWIGHRKAKKQFKKTLKNLKPQIFIEGEGEEELYYRFKEFSDNPGFPENWTIGQESNYNNDWVIRDNSGSFKDSKTNLETVLITGLKYI